MRTQFRLATVILGIALLTAPALADNQRHPQPAAIRPPAAAFHNAPAFRPPRPAAAAPRIAYHQPPIRNFQPPHINVRPQQPPTHQVPPARPRLAVNQPAPKLPINHLPGKPVNGAAPPALFARPRSAAPAGARGFTYPPRDAYTPPQPGVICDGDGDNCRPAPQVVCDGDGDDCRQVPYNNPAYGYGQAYYPPAPPVVCDGDGDDCRPVTQYPSASPYYQQIAAPYYSHPEPDGDDYDAYYLPYQAPPVVCDEDGDDCGPAPYFNEAYRAWAPLQPLPVALSMNPAYYASPELYRLRGRLIAMDQAARARYMTAVQQQQMRQARHLYHETRSLDAQLSRLDSQARRAAGVAHQHFDSASIR